MDRLQKAVALAREKKEAKVTERTAANTGSTVSKADASENIQASLPEARVVEVSKEQLAAGGVYVDVNSASASELQVFRLLRTIVLSKTAEHSWRTIAISSPTAGQGRSTIAANLAVTLAKDVTNSVLVVDLDLRNPSLHAKFSLDVDTGLADLIRGDASLDQVLINPSIDRLTVLPGHGTMLNSSENLSKPVMIDLFKKFSGDSPSKYVVYCLPPILESDDVLKVINKFDCSLLVVEDGGNSTKEIRESLQVMKRTNFLGYVINKSDTRFSIGAD